MHKEKPLILLEFNEISMTILERYFQKGYLKNFEKLLKSYPLIETFSENDYENLEPWIQWVTVHTGKDFDDHKIFRLGDAQNQKENIWNEINKIGKKSMMISPMNALDPNLEDSIFIPDPWTKSSVKGGFFLKILHKSVSSIVNNNSNNRYKLVDLILFLISFVRFARVKNYFTYFKLIFNSRSKKWAKAILLDVLLSDVFIRQFSPKKFNFGSIFLNGAAHIQHHYFFSSKVYQGNQTNPEWYCSEKFDPLLEVYEAYDKVLGEIFKKFNNCRIILLTALSQSPTKFPTYYWRLKNHDNFLKSLSINFKEVLPRMSRDFLINFSNSDDLEEAKNKLLNLRLNNKKLFEIDDRGNSLFVTLSFSDLIDKNCKLVGADISSNIKMHNSVSLVALKNGEHQSKGYLLDSFIKSSEKKEIPLKEVYGNILSHFSYKQL